MSFTGIAGGAGSGSNPAEFGLHEEFLLLCLHDNKGAIRSGIGSVIREKLEWLKPH